MKRLSIGIRFSLSIVIFSFPIVVLMFYLWQVNQSVLDFSSKELEGIEHLLDGLKVKDESYQLHLSLLKGSQVDSQSWTELEKKWSAYFDSLEDVKIDRGLAQAAIKKYIEAPNEAKKSGELLFSAIRDTAHIRDAIADTHNVMLDPDSDSFYVMDLVIVQLPVMQQLLAELVYLENINKDQLTPEQKFRLFQVTTLLEQAKTKAIANLDKALEFDEQYYGKSASLAEAHAKGKSVFKKIDSELIEPVHASLVKGESLAEFSHATLSSFEATANIHHLLLKEFKTLVQTRYNYLNQQMQLRLGLALGAMIFAILFSLYLGASISGTLKTFQKAVDTLKGEAKEALNIGQLLIGASKRVSDSSSEQAAAIEETSASLEEISSMVKHNADSSTQAQEVAALAKEQTTKGTEAMESLLKDMGEISQSSKKIEEIMRIIDDIAFQTNLLALNASVEAARAGEHGKGFAVVADAVRSLAQRSADSAKQISELIKDSLYKIESGRAGADKTGEVIHSILASIEKVNSLNTEIAQASHEQTAGISQITKAISDLEQSTMENSGVASQASEYSQKSLSQAEGLMRVVDILEAELKGKKILNAENESNFNFEDAVQAHLKWKGRLRNFISGMSDEKLQSQHVCKDNNCALGKWIYGEGKNYSSLSSYAVLRSEHANFHVAAGEVLKAFEGGDVMTANRLLAEGSKFDRHTRMTVEAIQNLQGEIKPNSQKLAS
ncbi:MAG: methyl-accepting chemotaxis protein [Bdellovibrionia bacterium]